MTFTLFLFCITLLAVPAYRILNVGQICLFTISSIAILAYYFKRALLGKKPTVKLPLYLMAIIVLSISYNLRGEKSWIGYIPIVQLLVALFFFTLLVNKRKKTGTIEVVSRNKNGLAFIFAGIAILFMALATVGWLNFSSADLFYKEGNLQLTDGKTDKAVLNFITAINKKPNLYAVYPKLCSILYKEGRYDDVIGICRKGASYLHMSPNYYDVFCFYLGSSYFRKEKPDETFCYYDKLIRIDRANYLEREFSNWTELNFYKGHRYSRFKRWDEAIKEYETVLLVDPKNSITRFKICEAYYFLGKSEDALKIFEDLINSGFKYRDIFLYIADLYTSADMFDKAIIMYERYATMNPDKDKAKEAYFRGYEKIGKIYERTSRKDEAINTYKKLLALKDRSAEVYYLLGNTYRYFQMEKEAEGAYLKAMKIDWYNKKGYYGEAGRTLGYIYEAKQNWKGAMRLYKSILARGSKEAYCYLGELYLRRKMWDEANRAYDIAYSYKSLGMPYFFAQPYQKLLEEYERQGRRDKVADISERLVDIGPNWLAGGREEWRRISLRFADLCRHQGKYEKADKVYRRILFLYPEDKEVSAILK